MSGDREELEALRRLAELEAKAGGGKPSRKETPTSSPLMDAALAASRGLFTGGPLLGLLGESSRQFDKAMEGAAYSAGGAVTDKAAGITSPETAAKLGYAANVGIQAVPTILGGELAKTMSPAIKPAGRFLMHSAMKPTLEQVRKGRAKPAVETMLREGFNPTAGGVEKMKDTISGLNEQVSSAINKSGATIDTRAVADYVPDAYSRFQFGPRAVQSADDLGRVQAEFLEHPSIGGAREIPVQLAQEMKSGYQRAIGDKGYGDLKTAVTEGEKQIARGLREKIAEAVPAVSEPLKRESDIIRALKIAERRVAVDANKNPIGLGWLASPWMIPFWMWDRSPGAKAMAGRMLYSEQTPATLGRLGGGYYGLLSGQHEPTGVLSER